MCRAIPYVRRAGNEAAGEVTRRSSSGSGTKLRVTTNDPVFELFI
jgi:hypothetical protein